MSKNANNATPADVAALVEEKKPTVPAQNSPEENTTVEETTDEKVTFGSRLKNFGKQLKTNRKAQISLGVVVTAIVVTAIKLSKSNTGDVEDAETTDDTVDSGSDA